MPLGCERLVPDEAGTAELAVVAGHAQGQSFEVASVKPNVNYRTLNVSFVIPALVVSRRGEFAKSTSKGLSR